MPTATFNYSSTQFCSDAANPSPSFSGGGIAGTFSSTAGLSITPGTGVINIAGSTAGSYTVTNTVTAAGCANATDSKSVTITTKPTAGFTYNGSPFCKANPNPSPVMTGTKGVFSSNPSGVVFATTATGDIDLFNTPANNYTILNTIAASGGCAQVQSSFPIVVSPTSFPTFNYPGTPYCKSLNTASPNFTGGGVAGNFTVAPAVGLSINASTGVVNPSSSTAGSYVVTNNIAATNPCPAFTDTGVIVISPVPLSNFSYPNASYCKNGVNPTPTFSGGGVAGTFTSSPAGLSINSGTGLITLNTSTAGTYTVTNTVISPGCTNSVTTFNITITDVPDATFSYTGTPYCSGGSNPTPTLGAGASAGNFTSTAGLSISNSTGLINLGLSTPGTYTVTNSIAAAGGCGAVSSTTTVQIIGSPAATFNYAGTPYCSNAVNPSPTYTGGGIAGTFTSSPAGLSINSLNGQINIAASTPGSYTVTNTVPGTAPCSNVVATNTITINALPVATFKYSSYNNCSTGSNPSIQYSGGGAAGAFTVLPAAGLTLNPTTGAIVLSSSTAGTYTVTNTIAAANGCAAVTDTAGIKVISSPVATFSYAGSPYCQDASNPLPTFPIGASAGNFTAGAGLSINSGTGLVNLLASTPGTYTVTNAITATAPCVNATASNTITVTKVPDATFSYTASPYCRNVGNPLPNFVGGALPGTFSSTAGLSFVSPTTGQINLSGSTAGAYVVTNTIAAAGGCAAVSKTANVTLRDFPTGTISGSAGVCVGGSGNISIALTGTPPWDFTFTDGTTPVTVTGQGTSPYVTAVSPAVTSTYTISSITNAQCTGTASGSAVMTINTAPTATLSGSSTICSGAAHNMVVNLTGTAPWSFTYTDGTTPVSLTNINSTPYLITTNPTVNTTYSLSGLSDANCAGTVSGTATATITTAPTVALSGGATLCSGQSTNLTATFTGTPPWDITYTNGITPTTISNILTSPHVFSVSPLFSGNYTITSVTDANCTGSSSGTATMIVNSSPTATISGSGSVCAGSSKTLTVNFTGSSPWDFKYSDGSTTTTVNNVATSPHTFNVSPASTKTYTITQINNASCTGTSAGSAVVNVTAAPTATLSGTSSLCSGVTKNLAVALTGTQPWTVIYTDGTNKDTLTGITTTPYAIPVSPTSTTTYSLVSVTDANCAGTVSGSAILTVTNGPTATISGSATICNGGSTNLSIALTGTAPWNFTYSDGTTPVSINNRNTSPYTFSVSPVSSKAYSVTSVTDASGCTGSTVGSAVVVVANPPTATISGSTSICNGQSAPLSVALTGLQPWSITYTDGGAPVTVNAIASSPYTFNVNPASSKTYTITSLTGAGCPGTGSGSAVVTVKPANDPTCVCLASGTLTGTSSICSGTTKGLTVTLQGSQPWSFTYTNGVTPTTVTGITTSPYTLNVTPVANTTYTLTSVSDKNCTGSAVGSALVTVNPKPTATISGNATVCAGTSSNISIVLTGQQPWSVTYTNGTTPVTVTGITVSPHIISVSPLVTSTYTVSAVSDANCAGTPSGAAVITVNPKPTATISNSSSICVGDVANMLVTLTGSSPWSFDYSDGTTTTPVSGITSSPYLITASPASSKLYSVSNVIDGNCSGTASGSANVTVNPKPTASIVGAASICAGANANLTLTLTGTAPWSITYTDGVTPVIVNGIATSPHTISVSPSATSTYTLSSVTDANCDGTVSGSGTITVKTSPTATISGSASKCAGQSTNLSIAFTGTSPWSYTYTDGTTPVTVNNVLTSPQTVAVSPASSKAYTVTNVTDASTCSAIGTGNAVVTINPSPTATISGNSTICPGQNTNLNIVFTGNPPYDFTYFDGTTSTNVTNVLSSPYSLTVSPASSRTYTVTAITGAGCVGVPSGSAVITVRAANNPLCLCAAAGILSGSTSVCPGTAANLTVTLSGLKPWGFSYSDGTTTKNVTNIVASSYTLPVTPIANTTYTLTAVNDSTCTGNASGSAVVSLLTKPTAALSGAATICVGDATTLTATLTGTAPWSITYSDGTTTSTINGILTSPHTFSVSPVTSKTFTITSVTDAICSGTTSGSAAIVVRPTATATLSGSGNICIGGSTTLSVAFTGSQPWGFSYSDGTTTTNVTAIATSPYTFSVNPALSTTYSLTAFSDKFCAGTTSGSAVVTVKAKPTLTSAGGGTICPGQSATINLTLTGTAPYTVTYNTGAAPITLNNILSSPYALVVNPNSTTTYNFTNVNDASCSQAVVSSKTVTLRLPTDSICTCTTAAVLSNSSNICIGSNANLLVSLTGTSPWNIKYSDGTTTTSVNGITSTPYLLSVNPVANTNYSLTYVKDGVCTGSATGNATVTVNSVPSGVLSGAASICSGGSTPLSVTLNGTPPWTITYSNGAGNQTINNINTSPYIFNVSPVVSTNYSLVSVSDVTCTGNASGTALVNVKVSPTANVSGTNSICSGSSTSLSFALTGTAPWSFDYSDGTTTTTVSGVNTSPRTISVSPASTTTYSLVSVNDANCTSLASDTAVVTIKNKPTATISGSTTICPGVSTNLNVILTGTAPWSITYTDGTTSNTVNGILSSPYSINVSPASTKTYTISSVSDAAGCGAGTANGSAVITVRPPADPLCTCVVSATLSGSGTMCNGGSKDLSVAFTGTQPWSFSYSDGTTTKTVNGVSSSPYTLTVSPASTKTYTLTAVSNVNCSGSFAGSAVVVVNSAPTATISGGAAGICANTSANLQVDFTGTQPWDFTYTDGITPITVTNIASTPYNFSVNPLSSSNYTISTVTDANCTASGSGTASVQVNALPNATLTGNATICNGTNTNLNIILTGAAPWNIIYNDGTADISVAGIMTSPYTIPVSPSVTTSYTLVSVLDANCTGVASGAATVTVRPNGDPLCSCIASVNLSGGGNVCTGSASTLNFAFTGVAPYSVVYFDGVSNTTISGINSASHTISVNPSATKTYSVVSMTDNTCSGSGTGTAVVVVNPKPTAVMSGTSTICQGSNTNLNLILTGSQPWTLNYSDGVSSFLESDITSSPYSLIVSPNSNKTYSINSISDVYCAGTGSGSAVITVKSAGDPTCSCNASVSLSGGGNICPGGNSNLTFNFTGVKPYSITYTDGTTPITVNNIFASSYQVAVSPASTSTYSVVSMSDSSCTGSGIGTAVVVVNTSPSATISGGGSSCAANNTNLSIALTGQQPWNITYSDGSTNTSITGITSSPYIFAVNPGVSTSYSINTVSDLYCSNNGNGTANVLINNTPTATMSGSGTICKGDSTNLSVSFTGTQPWNFTYSDGTTNKTITGVTSSPYSLKVIPGATSTYSMVTVNDASCNGNVSGSAVIQVLLPSNPLCACNVSATISGGGNICAGNSVPVSVALTGSSPWNFTYSDGVTPKTLSGISVSPHLLTLSPAITSTYIITSVNNVACFGSGAGSAVAQVSTSPTASLLGSTNICAGDTASLGITLTGSQPWTVVYSNGSSNQTITGITNSNYVLKVAPNATKVYSLVSVADANCAGSVSGTATVAINAAPTISITGGTTICSGKSTPINFVLTGAAPWNFSYSDGTTTLNKSNVNTNPYSVTVSPTANTTYSLLSISDANCTGLASGNTTITVKPANDPTCLCTATANISGGGSVCAAGSTNLVFNFTGIKPWSVTYTDGTTPVTLTNITQNSKTVNITPSNTATYVISAINDSTCTGTGSGSAVILKNVIPTATLSGKDTICSGLNANLKVAFTGSSPWSVVYSDGTTSKTINNILVSPHVFTVSPASTTTYNLVSSFDANCTGTVSGSANVLIGAGATATLSGGATICKGGTTNLLVTLTGTAPWNFTYDDGSGPKTVTNVLTSPYTLTVAPTSTSNYSLIDVNDATGGCSGTVSGSATVTLRANNDPICNCSAVALITGGSTICEGQNAAIQVVLGGTKPWDVIYTDGVKQDTIKNIQTSPHSITVSPSTTTNYSLISVKDFFCTGSVSGGAVVTVNPNPAGTISGSKNMCLGDTASISVALNGNGPWDLTYTDGSTNTTINNIATSPYTFKVSPLVDKVYSIVSANNATCNGVGAGAATISINAKPTADISGSTSICTGDSTNINFILTGTSPWNVTYFDGTSNKTINGITSSPAQVFVKPVATTNYTLISVSDASCSGTITNTITKITVKAANDPTCTCVASAVIAGANAVCGNTGSFFTINFTGKKPYTASYTDGTTTSNLSNIQTTPYQVNVNPGSTKTYSLASFSDSLCAGSTAGSAVITVNAIPTATLSGGGTNCAGASQNLQIDFTGVAPWSVTYSDGNSNQTINNINISPYILTVSPNTTTSYSLVSTADANCTGTVSGSADVIISSSPTATIAGSGTICKGQSANISVALTGAKPWSIIYTNGSKSDTINNINTTPHTISISPTTTSAYSLLSVTDASCSGTVSGSASYTVLPVNDPLCNCSASATLTGGGSICKGSVDNLLVTLVGTAPFSFTLNDGNKDTVISNVLSSPYLITLSPSTTTTYSLVAVQDAKCKGIANGTATIQVNSSPTASLGANQTICPGDSATISIALSGSAPWNFTYSDGVNPVSITNHNASFYQTKLLPSTSSKYKITALSDAVCVGKSTDSTVITVNSAVTATLSGNQTLCSGKVSNIDVLFTGTSPWSITLNNGSKDSVIAGITQNPYALPIKPTATSTYTLKAVSDKFCTGTTSGSALVTVLPANDPLCSCSTSVVLSGGGALCSGGTGIALNLNFTGTQPWDVTLTDGTSPISLTGITQNPYTYTASPSNTSTYAVTSVKNATCTGLGSGTSLVVVNTNPTATLSGGGVICTGASKDLIIDFTGNKPWSVTYSDGVSNKTISNINLSKYTLTVSPSSTSSYSLVSVSDSSCAGTVSGNADVIVNQASTANLAGNGKVCNGKSTNINLTLTGTQPWQVVYNDGIKNDTIKNITSSPYSINVSPIATSTYTLLAANDNSCPSTVAGTANITVLPANDSLCNCSASATLAGGANVCKGSIDSLIVTLQGTSPWTITYNDGVKNNVVNSITSSPYSLKLSPSTSTTYSLVSVKDATCTGLGTGSGTIQVSPAPTASLTGVQTICNGDSATISIALTGTSPWNFNYSDGTNTKSVSNNVSNPYIFSALPSSSSTYKVTTISDKNCAGTATGATDITINDSVTATISGSQTICSGKTSNIDVVFKGTSPWNIVLNNGAKDSTISGITANPYQLSIKPSATTTYTIKSVSDKLCLGIGKGSAIVKVLPANDTLCTCSTTVALTGGGNVCNGSSASSLQFNFTGTQPWTVTLSDGSANPIVVNGITANPYTYNVSPLSTTTYSATKVRDAGCTGAGTGTAVVLINKNPTASLNGSSKVCAGTSSTIKATLTGTAPWSIVYSDGVNETTVNNIQTSPHTITVNPASTTIYSLVSVTDKTCSGSVAGFDTVMVNPSPTGIISGTDTLCAGTKSNFNIVLTGTAPWDVTYTDGTTPVTLKGIVQSPYQVSITPTTTTSYTLTFVSDAACTGTVSGTANIVVRAANSPICLCTAKATLSGGTSMCLGTQADLTVDFQGTAPWSITYTDGSLPITLNNINSNPFVFKVQPFQTKTYKLTAVSDKGNSCKGAVNGSAIVNVNPFPIANVSGSTSICSGGSALVKIDLIGTAPFTLAYSDGIQIDTIKNIIASPYVIKASPTSTQVFSVPMFKDAQCSGAANGAAVIAVNPVATAKITGGTAICSGTTTNLNVIFTGNKPWSFTYTDGASKKTVNNINVNPYSFNVNPTQTTTYSLVQLGDSTCSGNVNSSTTVTVLPNSDPKCVCTTTAKLTGTSAVCSGLGTNLNFTFTGTSPWNVVYTDSLNIDTLKGITTNPYVLTVKPTNTSTYTILSVSNATCTGNSNGSAAILVNKAPSATLDDTAAVCKTGVPAKLKVNLTGTAPWTLTYNDGVKNQILNNVMFSPYDISISTATQRTVTLKSVSDKNCNGPATGTGLVLINPPHTLSYSGNPTICTSNLANQEYAAKGGLSGSSYYWNLVGGGLASDTSLSPDSVVLVNWASSISPAKKLVFTELTKTGCATDSLIIPIVFDSKGYDLQVVTNLDSTNAKAQLIWTANGLSKTDSVTILRKTTTENSWTKVNKVLSSVGKYTDGNLNLESNIYQYKLLGKGLNMCGDTISSAIHQSIHLKANSSQSQLNWNPYKGWAGVKEYQIWTKSDPSKKFVYEATVDGADSNYILKQSSEPYLCFVIKAIEKAPNNTKPDTSVSNTLCMSFNYQTGAVNAFSPNANGGDGVNDYFFIKNIDKYPNNTVYIFNRWGNVVYKANNYDNNLVKWNGDNSPEGTYFFIVQVGDEVKQKGTVLIQR